MKRILSFLLALLLLLLCPAAGAEPVITERKGEGVEAWLWTELSQNSPSDVVTAAVLSYFWRESQFRSDAAAGWGMSLAGYGIDLCAEVTEQTDAGLADGSSREYFLAAARQYGGYGLGQWSSERYTAELYDFAAEYGTSIADAKMQCAFVFVSMKKTPSPGPLSKPARIQKRPGG